jgi:hypothetical protein
MKPNMGTTDKVIRLLIVCVVASLYYINVITGMLAFVLLLLAGVFLFTSMLSFCPLYLPLGISTRKKEK